MIKNYKFLKDYRGPMGTFSAGKVYPLDTNMGKMIKLVCEETSDPVSSLVDTVKVAAQAEAPVKAKRSGMSAG